MDEDILSESSGTLASTAAGSVEMKDAAAEIRPQMTAYMKQLLAEKQRLDGAQFSIAQKLLTNELERLQSGGRPLSSTSGRTANEERRFADIIKDKPIKVTIRVLVPVREHPKFNFVGKLLGPKGNSLKRLQEDTMTKMAVLGRGSMRDKQKEEELRASNDPKYAHFNDELHVEITAFAPPAEAHARIAYALAEVRKFMVPDYNDEIRQEQMREMHILNTSTLAVTSQGASTEVVVPTSSGASPVPSSTPTAAALLNKSPSPPSTRPMPFPPGNGRGAFLYSQQHQQLLLHPAFRGLTPRPPSVQLPGAAVFRGSILNRLRPALAPAMTTPGSRVSPSILKQHRNSILSILAGGPRTMLTGDATTPDQVLVCGEEEEAAPPPAATMYSLYDNYAAAAAAVSGTGYGLLESFANGNGVLTADTMEDITSSQEAVSGPVGAWMYCCNGGQPVTSPEMVGRSDAGAVKMDRGRYRVDPYARFTGAGVKLPM